MTERRRKYLKDKLYELYTLLYKAASPSVDFRELVAKSPWVKRNNHSIAYWKMSPEERREVDKTFEYETIYPPDAFTDEEVEKSGEDIKRKIDWDSYYLDKDTYDKIVKDFINDKKNKFSSIEKHKFTMEAYLGCGPTTYDRSKEQIPDNGEQDKD